MSKVDHSSTDAAYRTRPAWNPGNEGGSSRFDVCQNDHCDNQHVDPTFSRVFGAEDGPVFACPECASWTALRQGAAANPGFETRVKQFETGGNTLVGR
ncbi:DUF7563 family protein [Haladaptatus sp. NG-SE-30]